MTDSVLISVDDLKPFAPDIDEQKALAMIMDAMALAVRVAPCILSDDFEHADAAKAILRGAILRWNEQGTGDVSQISADVFGMRFDGRRARNAGGFLDKELRDLAALCRPRGRGAFSINLVDETDYYDPPSWMEFVDP